MRLFFGCNSETFSATKSETHLIVKKKNERINFLFVVVGLNDKNQILTDQSTIWMMLRPYNTYTNGKRSRDLI